MPKITPFLWFNDDAEQAAEFYVSLFDDAKIIEANRLPTGAVMSITFRLEDQEFMALNGGPHYKFSEATSFFVNCETQEEVDKYWDALADGAKALQCGWVTDKFGVTWQIIPSVLGSLLGSSEPGVSQRVTEAMMKMQKLDIAELQRAAATA